MQLRSWLARLAFPLVAGAAAKGVKRIMQELLVIIAAQAVKVLRGTVQYQSFLQGLAESLKAVVPGHKLEPEIALIFEDLAGELKRQNGEG